ncbi:MAG: DUF4388 domain-containing protein [Acidimicrobiia bacterium]
MALHGTLDSFSLGEVLSLLAQTGKTGALLVSAPDRAGALYVVDGMLCGAELEDPPESTEGIADDGSLEEMVADLAFELFRLGDGDFEFIPDRSAPAATSRRIACGSVVERVQEALAGWDDVEAVVPSSAVVVRLVPEPGPDVVAISRSAWRAVLAVDGTRTVREVARELGCGVVVATRAVKELVEAGAAELVGSEQALPCGPAADGEVSVIDRALPEPDAMDVLADLAAGEPDEVELEPARFADPAVTEADPAVTGVDAMADPLAHDLVADPLADELAGLGAGLGEDGLGAAEAGGDGLGAVEPDEAREPVRAHAEPRDRGALLRMFSSLRDA